MDELVLKALKKWPNVPSCFGWLGLDARAQWYMRDETTQAKGPFETHKGSRLSHQKLIDFISRNYQDDEWGQWYFQNGPQRVYVELETTPWIWRVHQALEGHELWSHTGVQTQVQSAFEDEHGMLYLMTPLGFGRVHTLDMWAAVQMLEEVRLPTKSLLVKDIPVRFEFVLSPLRMSLKSS